MQMLDTVWPPRVGDVARVKENGLLGKVVKTKGVYEARFRLQVLPVIVGGGKPARGQTLAARIASRWYGLDELERPS
jgi:hypothetical protein